MYTEENKCIILSKDSTRMFFYGFRFIENTFRCDAFFEKIHFISSVHFNSINIYIYIYRYKERELKFYFVCVSKFIKIKHIYM